MKYIKSLPSSTIISLLLLIGITIFSVANLVWGFTEPTALPPGGNVSAPLNVSGTAQTKAGSLAIGGPSDTVLTLHRDGVGTVNTNFRLGTDNALVINNSGFDTLTLKGGKVGIGMADPGSKLDVSGTFHAKYIRSSIAINANDVIELRTSAANAWFLTETISGPDNRPAALMVPTGTLDWWIYNNYLGTAGRIFGVASYSSTIGGFIPMLETANVASGVPNLVLVRGAGNVGIGTASPSGLQVNLAVSETARSVDNVRLGVVDGTPRIIFEDSASTTQHEIDNEAGTMRFFRPGVVSMTINSSGNVGIGTPGPTAKLELGNNQWLMLNPLQSTAGINFFETGTKSPASVQYGGKIYYDGFSDTFNIVTMENNIEKQGLSIARATGDVRIGANALMLADKNVDNILNTYYVSKKRYHVEATKALVKTTVPLDMTIVNDLCKDEDGCSVTIGMRNWNSAGEPGLTASRGPYRLFIARFSSNFWRLSNTDASGKDGDGAVAHILVAWDCYFTDGEYASGAETDSVVQLGLLNWNDVYTDLNMICILDIDD